MEVSITLDQNVFNDTNSDTVVFQGYRMIAHITVAGGQSQGELQMRIYGLSLKIMNQLSTLGKTPVYTEKNTITVFAGDDFGISEVFKGTIQQAYTDLGSAPDNVFHISAFAGLYEAMQIIPATSIAGAAAAEVILSGLAGQMGKKFENNGVHVMLDNPNYSGSAKSQMDAVINDADIRGGIFNDVLAIWPKDGNREGNTPMISPATGMIGYPFPSGQGLLGVRTLFNPDLAFGCNVEVQSDIQPACGIWTICHVDYDLEAEVPGGAWFGTLLLTPPGYLRVS